MEQKLPWMQSMDRTPASDEDVDGYGNYIIYSGSRNISLDYSHIWIQDCVLTGWF
jgi:hypothetical protein